MNKIIQTQDFLFASSRNGITNLEQDNIFDHLNIPEDKSFSDLNLFSIGNQPLQFNFDVKNDFTINSFDDFQDSKKSELGFEYLAKDIKKDQFEYEQNEQDVSVQIEKLKTQFNEYENLYYQIDYYLYPLNKHLLLYN